MLKIINKLFNKVLPNNKRNEFSDNAKLIISKHLPENPIILEAGCFDGTDTIEMSTLWPKSKIYCFEPVPEISIKTRERLKSYHNVFFFDCALGTKDGETEFYISEGSSTASSSLSEPDEHLIYHPEVAFKKIITIPCLTIDTWAKSNNVDYIDLLWLDMQGAEQKVLEASPNILSKGNLIFSEVSLVKTYKDVMLYPDFKKWMESQKYKVVWEDLPYKDMGNVLFKKTHD